MGMLKPLSATTCNQNFETIRPKKDTFWSNYWRGFAQCGEFLKTFVNPNKPTSNLTQIAKIPPGLSCLYQPCWKTWLLAKFTDMTSLIHVVWCNIYQGSYFQYLFQTMLLVWTDEAIFFHFCETSQCHHYSQHTHRSRCTILGLS